MKSVYTLFANNNLCHSYFNRKGFAVFSLFVMFLAVVPTSANAQTYKVSFGAINTGTNTWCAGETRSVSVTVTNTGTATWTSAAANGGVNFSYWWNTQSGRDANARIYPFSSLGPNQSQTVTFNITAPAAGAHTINFDLVRELVCWFGLNNGGCGTGNVVGSKTGQTVYAASTLGSVSNAGPINFCNSDGNFGTGSTVSSQTGSIVWNYGTSNGSWSGSWSTAATSPTSVFPKKTNNTTNIADKMRYNVTNGTCPTVTSSTISINNRYNEAPTSLSSNVATPYCSNAAPTNITLTATFPALINMRGTVKFYSGSCGGTLVGTVNPNESSSTASVTIAAPTVSTTYFARYEPGTGTNCSNTACVSTTVTVHTTSTVPATIALSDNNICSGNSTTLTASGGTAGVGATFQWYAGDCGLGSVLGTTASITVSPTITTTYYVRRINACNTTACISATVNVLQSQGNPADFGDEEWNVYAWNAGDISGGSGAWTNNYSGYYTINSLNFDTRLGQTYSTPESWDQTTQSPSNAAGYSGCTVAPDNHSYAAKRKGFACGVYQINIPNHDDAAILRINGSQVWAHTDGCCDAHSNVWTGVLGPISTVELRISEQGGGSHGSLQFVNVGSLAITSSNATMCSNAAARTLTANYGGGTWSGTGVSGNTFNPSGLDGTYTITYSWQGCSTTQNISVTPAPSAVAVTPSPAYGCGSVTLDATGGTPGTIYWQNTTNGGTSTTTPSASQTVSTNATYYFRAVNSGCWSTQGSSAVTIYNLTGGTFTFTNPYTCGNSGTITVSGVTGGTGTYQYSRDNGANWQSSASFTNVPAGAHTILVRNSTTPYCETVIGSCTMYQPYSPIPAVPTVSNSGAVCPGNTVNLTASGLVPGSGGSNSGGAYTFNGSSQYMNSASSAGLPTGNVTTVEAWINRNASQADASYNGIVSWGPRTCSGTSMLFSIQNTGRLSMATWCNDFVPVTGPIVPAGVWTHVAVVLNGTSVTFYINGQIAQTGTLASAPSIQATASQAFNIGATDNPGRYFGGSIDNVRVWGVVRTQSEIQGDMYKQVPTTGTIGTNLKALYNFNGNTNNSHGTVPNLTAINAPASMKPQYYTYTWSNNGDAPNPAASNNEVQTTPVQNTSGTFGYSVTASANSCSATKSTATNVVIHPIPQINIGADYCHIGGKVLLSANSSILPATYVWNTGATTKDLLVDLAGTYQVTVTATATGCTDTNSRSVAEELVVNGDFSAGVGGFTTSPQYTNQQNFYVTGNTTTGLYPEGKYAVNTWANSYHPVFFGADHTTGTGNFLMVNGSAAATPPVIWQQGPVTVLPNTDYYFSAWAVSLNTVAPFAKLRFSVNGIQVGTTADLPAGPSSNAEISQSNWVRFYGMWNSGSTTQAIISIVDNELAPGGNDFGLDDISFGTLSTFIELVSPSETDAQNSCVNYPIESIVYKVGSGPTGPVVTGLPPGVTSNFNGVTITISGTPTVPGTYDYELAITGNCAPAYAYGTITVKPTQSTSTWIGSSASPTATDWFDAENWSDCVPGTPTKVIIPKGRPSYPVITNTSIFDNAVLKGKAKAKSVEMGTTGSGATPSLDIQNGSELRVNE